MPSDERNLEFRPLPVAPRYTRRNADRAMAGSVVRGLVELITNGRDSGRRLLEKGQITADEFRARRVEVEYSVQPDARRLLVRDHFEGMTADVMTRKLLQYGDPASGFEDGASVRGLNARGAKDVAVLGDVKFESISGETYAECVIRRGLCAGPFSRTVTKADRERLKLQRNGTVVTLTLNPGVTIPRFDALAIDLDRHIELRYQPEGLPRTAIELRESKRGGREQTLTGFAPEGALVLEMPIELPEYARYGRAGSLRLYKSDEELQLVGARNAITRFWRSEAGVVVVDGRTAHDITFFNAKGSEDAAARYLFGELYLPHIPGLLRELEEVERQRERDASQQPDPLNPVQVTDPDRLGLNYEHPYVQAVVERVRPVIEQVLRDLQRELAPSAQERVSAELRSALEKLGEQLAERFELTGTGDDVGKEHPTGLRFIPGGLRVEIAKSKRLGVYYKPAAGEVVGTVDVTMTVSSKAAQLSTDTLTLVPVPDHPGLYSGSVEVIGRQLSDLVVVQAAFGGYTATARVTVREPTSGLVELDRDLQFSQRRYTSVPERRKRVEIFADPTLTDQDVGVTAAHDAVALSATSVRLEFDVERGVAAGGLFVESDEPATDALTASCGDMTDEAQVVFQELATKPKIEFLFDDVENFGPGRRFKWDLQNSNQVHIAAKHPTLSRVLGPDLDPSGAKWPGQQDPQARAILAELIAEAYVDRRLGQELPSLGIGPENLVDPVEYESYRYKYFDECFMICHGFLTPPYEG